MYSMHTNTGPVIMTAGVEEDDDEGPNYGPPYHEVFNSSPLGGYVNG